MGGIVVLIYATMGWFRLPLSGVALALLLAALALPLYAFARRPLRFGLSLAAVLIADPGALAQHARLLHQERSFFGVHRVMLTPDGAFHDLIHGTTLHGSQRVRPLVCNEATGYYHPQGPAGDVFRELPGRPGRWTFYEIDPAVERIASDTDYFCYLSACPADHRIVLGDARRSIAAASERYDLMVFDAYTSDAIPVHLLTREALRLYASRLAPGGVIVFHLSNRYFDLVPVIAGLTRDAGLECRVRTIAAVGEAADSLKLASSTYAVVARSAADFGALGADVRWARCEERAGVRVWTDDYSSLLSVLR
jgi:hypothetical protein